MIAIKEKKLPKGVVHPDLWPIYGADDMTIQPDPRQMYGTPGPFLQWVNQTWGAREIDVCAIEENRKAPRFYGPQGYWPGTANTAWLGADGLDQPWTLPGNLGPARVWCNPPFDDVGPWLEKAAYEARVNNAHVLVLTHASLAEWFRTAWGLCFSLHPIFPRIDFDQAEGVTTSDSNPRDSFLWDFRRDVRSDGPLFAPMEWPKPKKGRKKANDPTNCEP